MEKKLYQKPIVYIRLLEDKDVISSSTLDDENIGWIPGGWDDWFNGV